MAKTESFDLHSDAYVEWFDKNLLIYVEEVQTLKKVGSWLLFSRILLVNTVLILSNVLNPKRSNP